MAGSFRELRTYQMARDGARRVFEATQRFPVEERYSLTDQIRRSSRAVKAILAEAWARRRYRAAFISKIDEALGEAMETQSWLDDALDCGYLTRDDHEALDRLYQETGGKLAAMINRADDFCKNAPDHSYVHEDCAIYSTDELCTIHNSPFTHHEPEQPAAQRE